MVEAIVWLILWAVFAGVGAWIIFVGIGLIGVLIGEATDALWVPIVGALIAWISAASWGIFALVHVILQFISVVQLAVGG